MPRKRRITLGYAVPGPGGPVRVPWFEKELDLMVRSVRGAATSYTSRPDPLEIRNDTKHLLSRIQILLAHARAQPDTVYALWNAIRVGYVFNELRFHNNWGEAVIAAKRQRDAAQRGRQALREARVQQAHRLAEQVVREAHQVRRPPRGRPLSQRSFAKTVAAKLNRKEPPPEKRFTAESVRSILRAQHFFEQFRRA